MSAELIFSIASTTAVLSWILLAVAPRWSFTKAAIHFGVVPLLLSAAYLVLIVLFFGRAEGGFGSLADVMRLFTNPWAVLAGWIHYLAFDLFVGAWEVRDSERRGVSHWLVIPCLFLTFMFGPIGYLLYMVLRTAFGKRGEK
ncbi:MAG: DUF4281 domain-containing protein [Acidobacteria bacterium]|nr:DUF4281 domain-containing protein [Acidobacteriota bacterium]